LIARRLLTLPFRAIGLFSPFLMVEGLLAAARSVRRNLALAAALARRELTSRHAGQFLGALWAVGQPLFLMMLFVFIFGVVFGQRIGGTVEMPRDYTIYILSGLVPWLSFIPGLVTSCQSVLGNGHLVKQFTIDAEMFTLKDTLLTLVFWVVGMAVIAVYTLVVNHSLPWTYVLIPVALFFQFSIGLGLGWAISAVTVFVRDMREFMQMASTAGIYTLPIVYLPHWIPEIFRPFIYMNPFSYMIWVYQDILYFGRIEHPWAWVVSLAFSLLSLTFGLRIFQRLRPYFATYI